MSIGARFGEAGLFYYSIVMRCERTRRDPRLRACAVLTETSTSKLLESGPVPAATSDAQARASSPATISTLPRRQVCHSAATLPLLWAFFMRSIASTSSLRTLHAGVPRAASSYAAMASQPSRAAPRCERVLSAAHRQRLRRTFVHQHGGRAVRLCLVPFVRKAVERGRPRPASSRSSGMSAFHGMRTPRRARCRRRSCVLLRRVLFYRPSQPPERG